MTMVSKTVTGGLAAVLLTTAVATPAEAQRYRRYDRDRNHISLGDVVLGTIAVGGVVAAIGALSERDRYRRGYGYDEGRYGNRGYRDGRTASIDACAYEAAREAGRRYGGRARVRDIDDVDGGHRGYRIRGTVAVQSDYRYGRDGYGRGGYDRDARVQFTCTAYGGRVTGLSVGSNYSYGY